jgi:NAD(P)-dependent dehydrogenase (short-subunit alcohol dehydrogenase family)
MTKGTTALRMDGRVALITGAGRGLGRAYAIELAARGAAVVVNDPGVDLRGDGAEQGPADEVVATIRAAGGKAVANYGDVTSVADSEAMVKQAADTFGGIDIVVCNAGNNRRATFPDMTDDDFVNVMGVHLNGTLRVTKAAWPYMAAKRYGRLIFTTSQVGFYGKIDSVAYGAAKAGIAGLMHGVKLSATPLGIKVNCVSPFALTRMGSVFPREISDYIDPAQVAAAVVLMASEQCPFTGEMLIAGGGHFAMARTVETVGIDIADPAEVTAENLQARLKEIGNFDDTLTYPDALLAVGATFDRVKKRLGL